MTLRTERQPSFHRSIIRPLQNTSITIDRWSSELYSSSSFYIHALFTFAFCHSRQPPRTTTMMNTTTNNENAKPATTYYSSSSSNAAGISPVLHSSKPPATLVNSWNETRQARTMLDQCRRDKAFVETQLSNEQIKTERLERENSELHDDNAMLRAHLAAFETENPLPPGWERIFSDSQQRYFYSHAATKHSQWHYPTASEVRDPTIAKMRVEQNQDAHNRRLS